MSKTDNAMLTTIDNPWNPFTHFDEWQQFDETAGYHTMAFLARVAILSDEMSEIDQELAIDQAMEEIIRENVSGMHKLVYANAKDRDKVAS